MFHGHWKVKSEDSEIEVNLSYDDMFCTFEALHKDMRKLHKKDHN